MTSVWAHKLFVLIFPASCNQNQRNSGFQNMDFQSYICIMNVYRISCFDNQLFLSILWEFNICLDFCKLYSVRYQFPSTSSSYKSNRLCNENKHPPTCKNAISFIVYIRLVFIVIYEKVSVRYPLLTDFECKSTYVWQGLFSGKQLKVI